MAALSAVGAGLSRPKGERAIDERALTTPIPANLLPGDRNIVKLGDAVTVSRETASYPVFRRSPPLR